MVPEDLFTCSTSRYIFEKKARLTSSWFFFASNSFPGWLSGDGPSGKGPMHQAAAPGLNGLPEWRRRRSDRQTQDTDT